MPTLNETPLTRAATQLSMDIVQPLRATLVGRRFASINPYLKGDGKTALELTTISDLSDGYIQYNLPTGDEDSDSLVSTAKIVNVPVLYKKFTLNMRDILAWDNRKAAPGEVNSMNAIAASAASFKVKEMEEELIFNGWKPNGTDYEVKGFTQVAGNSVAGGSIATAGTMYGYVSQLIGDLEEDNVFGENNSWNLAVTPKIHAALMTKRWTNGDREYEAVQKLLGGGSIYVTPTLKNMGGSDNTDAAIVTPVDSARVHFEFLNPVDYRVVLAHQKFDNLSPIEGIVYELFTPSFNRANSDGLCDAVGKITRLTQ